LPAASLPPLTVAERSDLGKTARRRVPRASQETFESPSRDPVALLERQATTRVAELVPVRYERMAVTPFTFYRGAALVMATDLATTPNSGLKVQLCGDAHLSNFGMFASPERRLVFDVNDFDETLPGPFEWDVKRLVASLEVAGRENGFAVKDRELITLAATRAYRLAMRGFARMSNLDVWYARIDIEDTLPAVLAQVSPKRGAELRNVVSYAHTRDRLSAYAKLSKVIDGERRIVANPPLLVPVADLIVDTQERAELQKWVASVMSRYRRTLETDRRVLLEQYRFVDLARKVVGVGSVGTRCWVALMLGRDDDDPLFLQVKEAERSVLEEFAGRSTYENNGQRVVAGQRLMQAVSDILLGWDRVAGVDGVSRDYYVRQLRDWKVAVEIEALRPTGMRIYAELCAQTLARAHARSGDEIAIAAYLGNGDAFDRAITRFAAAYADQNERDHAALLDAIRSGRVTAAPTEAKTTKRHREPSVVA
jgi:uncharacterized protein (DUF2252 family)